MPKNPVTRVQNQKAKVREEIEKLQRSLSSLDQEEEYARRLTEVCPDCKGRGQERYTDAAGSGDWRDCSTCKGWGYVEKGVRCPGCGRDLDEMTHLRRQHDPHCPFCGQYLGGVFKSTR